MKRLWNEIDEMKTAFLQFHFTLHFIRVFPSSQGIGPRRKTGFILPFHPLTLEM
jgi:hypothetical protein